LVVAAAQAFVKRLNRLLHGRENAPLSIPSNAVGDCRGADALSTSAVGKSRAANRSAAGVLLALALLVLVPCSVGEHPR